MSPTNRNDTLTPLWAPTVQRQFRENLFSSPFGVKMTNFQLNVESGTDVGLGMLSGTDTEGRVGVLIQRNDEDAGSDFWIDRAAPAAGAGYRLGPWGDANAASETT